MRKSCTLLLVMSLYLTSCISISVPTEASSTPFIVTSTLPPTKGGAFTPGPALSPSASETATTPIPNPADCTDKALLLEDVTVPDNTNVPRGEAFRKTWRLKNSGTCAWGAGYALVFLSGDQMGAPTSTPLTQTAPGGSVDVSVDLVAPYADGAYTGIYELHDPQGQAIPIGLVKIIWVKITVGAVVGTPPTPLPNRTATPSSSSCKYVKSPTYINELFNRINAARAEAGLPALTLNSALTAAAQGHSVDMACHGLLSHSGSDGSTIYERITAQGYFPSYSLEVIYAGGYPQDAVTWWMNDPPHREAILSPQVTEFGIGYAYVADSAYGGYYTVDLARP